jgi:hypothetical protein
VGHAARKGERGHHHGGKRLKTFTVSNFFHHEINLASDEDRRGASAPHRPKSHRPFIRTPLRAPFVHRAPLQRRADIEAQAHGSRYSAWAYQKYQNRRGRPPERNVRRWTRGSGGGFVAVDAGHSRGPAIRDAVASAVPSAADFELGRVVVTIFEVPADKMKPAGSSDR